MLRSLWRWRIFVYAFGGMLIGYFMMAIGHPVTAAPLVDVTNLDQSFKLSSSGANLPSGDFLSPMINSLNGIQSQMAGYAEHLFALLVSLDVFWMIAQFMLTRGENLGEFFAQLATKVFTVVFVYYVLIEHGGELVTTIVGSFSYAASNANISGQYNTSASPTALLAAGAGFAAVPVAEAVGLDLIPDEGLGTGATNLSKAASEMLTGAAFAIFGAFSGLAAEIAIATLEVYVVLNLGIIVTGFLGSRWTERFGQGFLSFAISAGVKYMFVQIILGLMYPYLLETAATEAIPVVGPAIYAAIAIMVVAILHAVPSFAASALSGQSNSSGAQLAGAMSQVFGGLAGAAKFGGSLPQKNQEAREQRADKAFKADQMRDFYSGRSEQSATSASSANNMMQQEARQTASFEDKKPAATPAQSGSGTNGASSNGSAASGSQGAQPLPNSVSSAGAATKFSGADSSLGDKALGGGSVSNGAGSASKVADTTAPMTANGVSAGDGKPLDASGGSAAASAPPLALDGPASAATLFAPETDGVKPSASLIGTAAGANTNQPLKPPSSQAQRPGLPSSTGGPGSVTPVAKPLTSGGDPTQLEKAYAEAKKAAEKIPETAIGISAESLHAKSKDDAASLPPPSNGAQPVALPHSPGAAAAARPSVAAMTQQKAKPTPEPTPQGKPLQ